jgi:hypothetical protein
VRRDEIIIFCRHCQLSINVDAHSFPLRISRQETERIHRKISSERPFAPCDHTILYRLFHTTVLPRCQKLSSSPVITRAFLNAQLQIQYQHSIHAQTSTMKRRRPSTRHISQPAFLTYALWSACIVHSIAAEFTDTYGAGLSNSNGCRIIIEKNEWATGCIPAVNFVVKLVDCGDGVAM